MSQSLVQISHEINVRLEKSKEYRKAAREKSQEDSRRARDHRIAAGMLLIDARKRVDAGEAGKITWYAWLEDNIERSVRDCKRVMRIAGYVDPEEALERERAINRDNMARNRGTHKTGMSPAMEELVLEFNALSQREKAEFLKSIGAVIPSLSPPLPPAPPSPPLDSPSTPLTPLAPRSDSPSGESAAGTPAFDPIKDLWDRAKALFGNSSGAASTIGKLRKEHGDAAVMEAIVTAESELPSDPVSFVIACLNRRRVNGHGHRATPAEKFLEGAYRAVEAREARRRAGLAPDDPLLDC